MNYGALGVFIGSILEQIIAPIPSSIVVLGSSFFIMKGHYLTLGAMGRLIINVAIPAALGITTGSLVYYYLSYKIGIPFIERAGKYLGVTIEDIQKVEKKVNESRYDNLFLFAARCIPILPSIAINLFCGLIKYPLKKYLIITFFGAMIQATILGIAGWQLGNAYITYVNNLSTLTDIITVIIVLGVIIYIFKNRREKKKIENQ
jgi:membrane protein DedA with SNARE-associated domain